MLEVLLSRWQQVNTLQPSVAQPGLSQKLNAVDRNAAPGCTEATRAGPDLGMIWRDVISVHASSKVTPSI